MRRSHASSLVAVVLGLSVVASVMAGKKESAPDISIGELKAAIAENKVTVIDVNGTDSFKEAHIPGAINYETANKSLSDVLPKDKDALIVAYCGGPECGAYKSATKAAIAMGYTNVKHLSVGLSGWKSAGEKTDKAS